MSQQRFSPYHLHVHLTKEIQPEISFPLGKHACLIYQLSHKTQYDAVTQNIVATSKDKTVEPRDFKAQTRLINNSAS